MASDWQCVVRNYEITKNILKGQSTYEHPLKLQTVTVIESKGTRGNSRSNVSSRTSSSLSLLTEPLGLALEGSDPLSQFARQEEELTDPLSQLANEHVKDASFRKSKTREKTAHEDEELNWGSLRLGILNRFTTTEKLSLTTSFLGTGTAGPTGVEKLKTQTIVADKTKYRLEQLDEFDPDSITHMMNLTQQEYIQRIDQLNEELVKAWNNDQRVKSLKIAVQCAKMLSDTSVLPFYPSQFVLITDILDTFGKLVYERLKSRANSASERTDYADAAAQKEAEEAARESASEISMNWYYKVSSIRELVPRIYIEISILRSYEFLPNCHFDRTLMRLANIIGGITDPIVNTYARCYLVRVGLTVASTTEYMCDNFEEFLSIYPLIFSGTTCSELLRQRIEIGKYLLFYSPALDFIIKALICKKAVSIDDLLKKCKELENNGLLLLSILNSIKLEVIAENVLEFVNLLSSSTTEGISKGQLLRVLGSAVSQCPPLKEQRLPLLKAAFRTIEKLNDTSEYIMSVETWAPFIFENFPISTLNTFLGEIHRRMSANKAFEGHYHQLQSILYTAVSNNKQIELLLSQEHVLPYLDLFHKDSIRVDICKHMLTVFKNNIVETTSDEVVVNALMHLGKILNDYVTAMTVDDERRQIGELISSFIRQVDFRNDFERQLSFYVKCRGDFGNLDAVYITLVYAVNKLTFIVRRLEAQGKRSLKADAFVKACIAYCFITIPSIRAVDTQMDLYLLTGEMALLNQCLGQADASLEAALLLVNELPNCIQTEGKSKNWDNYLQSYLCNMLATLVVVPDSPDRGVLYFLRLLLDTVNKFPFETQSSAPIIIYLHALDMLYIQSLDEFPYHIPNVISNDELYGHDPKFIAEVNNLCSQVLQEILGQLKSMGAQQQFRSQATYALELLLRIVRYADLSKQITFQMAQNLLQLAIRLENYIDSSLMLRTIKSMEETHFLIKDVNTIQAKGVMQLLKLIRRESHS